MRKKLLSVLLTCLMTVAAFAGKEQLYVLHQGFEEGIPADWTQEYLTSYQQPWTVENAAEATFPKVSFDGSKYLALRNHTTQTQRFVTRLVTPVFDIKDVTQPMLIFTHAQLQRTGDVDTLRIYYRSSADSRWVRLREYADKISNWRTDTIALTAKTATYQLAFEGTDNFGRGIVIDEIIVRPKPTCVNPSNIVADSLGTNSATIRWMGSLDADNFHIILSTEQQKDLDNPAAVVQDLTVEGYQHTFSDLQRNAQYYMYIQSHCGGDFSDWVEYAFRTRNSAPLPYTENFNMDYASGVFSHVDYWVHGTSIKQEDGEMAAMPYVNRNIHRAWWQRYSYSRTTCLVFSGACDDEYSTSFVPAGQYVYAAAPEMQVPDIRNLEITFWGTAYQYVGASYAAGLIVGVMVDPNDFHTFVPVDTVYATQSNTFNRYTVYLDNYTGAGKFIAFASNFSDKRNIFYMDDLEIAEKSATKMITGVSVSDVRGAAFTVNANLNGNTRFQLVVARDTIDTKTSQCILDPSVLPSDYIFLDKELNASDLPYRVTLPEGGLFAQVYMRPVSGTDHDRYTLPVKVLVPMFLHSDQSVATSFEEDDPAGLWSPTQLTNFRLTDLDETVSKYPFSIITSPINNCYNMRWPVASGTSGSQIGYHSYSAIALEKRQEESRNCTQKYGDYVALPECESLNGMVLRFYMRPTKATKLSNRVAVGVMTDPSDPSTFEQITTCEVQDNTYRAFAISFNAYKGNGRFPAIMAVDAQNRHKDSNVEDDLGYTLSAQYIDSISLFRGTGCMAPTDVQCEPSYDQAVIRWTGADATEYVVRLYADADAAKLLDSVVVMGNTTTLKELTGHTTYYYSVATKCSADQISEADLNIFATTCVPAEPLPYIEDFESWVGGDKVQEPLCWTGNWVTYLGSYYPNIYNYSGYAHSGDKSLCLTFYNHNMLNESGYLALPPMEESISKLQMRFYAMVRFGVGDTLYVGVMTDPNDVKTFDTIAAYSFKEKNVYKEFVLRFEDYQGTGKHIAFMIPQGKVGDMFHIDDIKVDYLSNCEKVQNVSARDVTTAGADIHWTKGKATTWHVLLATKGDLDLGSSVTIDGTQILSVDTTAQMPFRITNCPNTNETYYAYVRAVCGEDKGEWSVPASFRTICESISAGDMGVIKCDAAADLDCWTLGCRVGTAVPKIYSQSLRIYNGSDNDGAYAIMRPVDVDSITRLQISFDAHGGTSANYLREITVGVITNPSDLSTFSSVKVLSLNQVSENTAFGEARRYVVRFDTYTGDYNGDYGKQIMFLSESGDKQNYVYIRNIRVDTIGKCLEPVEVNVADIEATTATVTWEQLDGSCQVQLFKTADDTQIVDTIVNGTAVRFDDLKAVTAYYTRVRHICGVGDTSVWSGNVPFKTTCPAAYPLPYIEDFESSAIGSLPDCWEAFGRYNNLGINTSAKKDGSNGLRMDRSYSNYSYAVLPKMDGYVGDLMLSFDYKKGERNYAGYLVVGIATDITSEESIASTLKVIDSLSIAKTQRSWYSYLRTFSTYAGEDGYIVLWAPKADKSANRSYIYVDNIRVEKAPTCLTPKNLTFKTATTTSIALTWTPNGKETAWDIAYVAKGGDIAEAKTVTVSTTTGTVTGLTPATDYDFYVRANCGNDDASEWSNKATGTTLTMVELADAHWNFDNPDTKQPNPAYTTYTAENGWIISTRSSSMYQMPNVIQNTRYTTSGTIASHYALSDSCALKFGSSGYAILPEINADLNTLQLRLSARAIYAIGSQVQNADSAYSTNTGNTTIQVGVLSDPYDWTTFELLTAYPLKQVTDADKATIVPDGHWEEVIVPLCGAKGKYIALVSESSYYVDNVVIEQEKGCLYPTILTVDTATSAYATLSWQSSKQQWQARLLLAADSTVVDEAIVNDKTWTSHKLLPTTDFFFAVRAICSAADTSAWITSPVFSTPCAPTPVEGYSFDFETNLFQDENYRLLPQCWTAGCLVQYLNMTPVVKENNTDLYHFQYSRRGEGNAHALEFRAQDKEYNSYVILPETAFEYDSVSLHFWMRAARFHTLDYTSGPYSVGEETDVFKRDLVIGTVADINDFSTFTALDTVTYSKTFKSGDLCTDDPTGNDFWEEVFIPLAKYADKGRLAIYYPGKCALSYNTSYMYIDDLEIIRNTYCFAPTNLRALDIHSNSATLSWLVAGTDSIHLQLAHTETFDSATVVLDTLVSQTNGRLPIRNLLPNHTYFFRLMHLCGEEETSDWATGTFTTAAGIRFSENFTALRTYPAGWMRGHSDPEKVFSGEEALAVTQDGLRGWERNTEHGAIAANEMITSTTTAAASENNHWLITPVIDLSSVAADAKLMLSFRLGLTGSTGGQRNPVGDKDKFIIAISEDQGATWTKENAFYWSEDKADKPVHSYAGIPEKGTMYHLDMAQYIGKQVKVAFISASTTWPPSFNKIRLASVQLNTVLIDKYAATICCYTDYEDENFSIDATALNVDSTTVYEQYVQAAVDGVQDKYSIMALTVNRVPETVINDKVCEGEDYTKYNFAILNNRTSNIYRQKLCGEGTEACDSIVTLHLTVTPRLRQDVYETICQGNYYEFNGTKYYTTTVHADTLSSLVSGCDSIVTLYLTVNNMLEGEHTEHICQGEFIEFGKFGKITAAGDYTDTIKNSLGCDSVATLHVFTHEPTATVSRAAICQGERYTKDNWQGLTAAGVYTSNGLKTVFGCDSIVTLHLMVAGADMTMQDSIAVDQLPYVLDGEELLPVGTAEGIYTKEVKLLCGTATLTITVGEPTGLHSVFASSLAIAPNPVEVGQDIRVLGSFAADAVVEVVSTTGARIYYAENVLSPVIIPGIPVSGAYLVTVTSNGQVFQSKLIVR